MTKTGKPLLELFLTYSWSFLTILALFTITVALDPFNNVQQPEMCDVAEPLIHCDQVTINQTSNTLRLNLDNNDFDTLILKDLTTQSVNEANTTRRCQQSSNALTSDNEITITCSNVPVKQGINEINISYYVYDAKIGFEAGRSGNILVRERPETQQTP